MECRYPVMRRIKGTRDYVLTPCGLCECCRKNYSHQWGIRIMNEALSYENNSFITLTFDDDHLPISQKTGLSTISKCDLQLFFKRLRQLVYPDKIRYFACGEYGEKGHRAHYHCIVFGLGMYDSRVFSKHVQSDDGFVVECKAWNKGRVHVAKVEIGSANYVAQYTMKKVKGKQAKQHYEELDIVPEFAIMSNKPGIGYEFMMKYSDDIKNHQFLIINGSKVGVPRYYKDKLGIKDTSKYVEHVDKLRDIKIDEISILDSSEAFQKYVKHRLEEREQYNRNCDFKFKHQKGGKL